MESNGQASVGTPAPPPKTPRPWRLRLRRMGIWIVCIYVGLGLLVRLFQSFIVFPGAHFLPASDTQITPLGDTELLHLKLPDGTPIAAWFGSALDANGQPIASPSARPAVIYFYGNGSCARYSENVLWHLRRMGLNVIIPDYPGYGSSGGSASEAGCYGAADAAYDELLRRGFAGRINVVGWSLGGGIAVDLASRRPVEKLALYDTFTSLHDMGRIVMPWFPTQLILSYKFDNIAKLPSIHCPIFLVHGQADSVVPPFMQDKLAAAATGSPSVTVIKIPGAEHNSIFEQGGDALWAKLKGFMNGDPAHSQSPATSQPSDNLPPL